MMNETQTNPNISITTENIPGALVSDEVFFVVFNTTVIICGCVALFGIATNSINMFVFLRMGLTDGVTVIFFALAMTDLGVTMFAVLTGLSSIMTLIPPGMTAYWMPDITTSVTIAVLQIVPSFGFGAAMLTTYLAVQRCCCVAFPFHFQAISSRKLTIGIVILLEFFTICMVAASLSFYTVQCRTAADRFKCQLEMHERPHRKVLLAYIYVIVLFILPSVCETSVLVSLGVMAKGLRKTAEFKKKSNALEDSGVLTKTVETSGEKEKAASSSPESRILKTVVLISTLFAVSNCFFLPLSIGGLAVESFDLHGYRQNLYNILAAFWILSFTVSSTLNFFIYLNSHSKFNAVFKKSMNLT